jgi:hypothetical protein
MVLISAAEAHEILQPWHRDLVRCVRSGFADLLAVQAEKDPEMNTRTRRNLLQNFVVRDVNRQFAELPGFRVVNSRTGRYLISVGDRLILQVKFLTEDFRTVNTLTETAKLFNAQADIEGLPSLPRLTLGYRLDALETAVEGVYVMLGVNNVPSWWYRIADEEGGFGQTGAEVLPIFPAERPARRVTPKKIGDEETKIIPLFGSSARDT